MGPTSLHTLPARKRQYRLRVPVRRRGVFYLLFLTAAGFLVFSTSMAVLVAMVVSKGLSTQPAEWLIAGLGIASVMIMLALVRSFDQWRHRKFLRPTELRSDRLEQLRRIPGAFGRLPHRWLESRLRQMLITPRSVRGVARDMPSGVTVFIADRAMPAMDRPEASDLVFEPLDVTEIDERTMQVADSIGSVKQPEAEADGCDAEYAPLSRAGWGVRRLTIESLLLFVIFAVFLGRPVLRLFRGDYGFVMAALVGAVGILVVGGAVSLLASRRWWVIPGGLCMREHRFWRRQCRVVRLKAEETPLLVFEPERLVCVMEGGRVRSFRTELPILWVLMATWLGGAKPPSEAELRAYLTSDEKA